MNTKWVTLISSLPGIALRSLVDMARLAERFNMRSQSRALSVYQFISLPIVSFFKLAIMTYFL